jgi:hypothetical protein
MSKLPFAEPNRRAVLRVLHDVDAQGAILNVQLEPLLEGASDDVTKAAWLAARRSHPWLVDDATLGKLQADQHQVSARLRKLITAASNLLLVLDGLEPGGGWHAERQHGYRIAIEHLKATDEVQQLRGAFEVLKEHGGFSQSIATLMRRA